jgi:hypothetical protein
MTQNEYNKHGLWGASWNEVPGALKAVHDLIRESEKALHSVLGDLKLVPDPVYTAIENINEALLGLEEICRVQHAHIAVLEERFGGAESS